MSSCEEHPKAQQRNIYYPAHYRKHSLAPAPEQLERPACLSMFKREEYIWIRKNSMIK